jgi:hypothetical protein
LLPALSRAKQAAQRASCVSQLKQQAVAWRLYLDDNAGRFPDAREMKTVALRRLQTVDRLAAE